VVREIDTNSKSDLRSVKTDRALYDAMYGLLQGRIFRKITVNDICTAALVSRAAFYAHYSDKYDLLENWLTRLCPQPAAGGDTYESIEKTVNEFVYEHKAIIKNIVNDADQGTLDTLLQIVLSLLNLTSESGKPGSNPQQVIQYNIYAGGIINYIIWQVRNNFPDDVKPMNRSLFKIIEECGNFDL